MRAFAMNNSDSKYLNYGPFCDPSNPEIAKLANQICAGKNKALEGIELFNWVRDQIKYQVIGLESASATLARGEGCCLAKSNLLVALARAKGIPARYRQFTGFLNSPDEQIAKLKHQHIIAELFVNGQWVAGDPAYDATIETVYEKGELGKTTWHNLSTDKVFENLPHWLWLVQRIIIWVSPSAHLVRRKVAKALINNIKL
jgi:transglutaminase-like putative cysteine protease